MKTLQQRLPAKVSSGLRTLLLLRKLIADKEDFQAKVSNQPGFIS
jgi:hypothetical protein